jgi:hypothetical protein
VLQRKSPFAPQKLREPTLLSGRGCEFIQTRAIKETARSCNRVIMLATFAEQKATKKIHTLGAKGDYEQIHSLSEKERMIAERSTTIWR